MRVGILTYHRANNYGAFLQAQALCCRLNIEDSIEAEIIDFTMEVEKKEYSYYKKIKKWLKNPAQIRFDIEQKKMFDSVYKNAFGKLSEDACVSDSIDKFEEFVAGKYDVIIAGSDEIWKLDGFRGFPNPYWLPGTLKCRKFSYAASSRSDMKKLTDSERDSLKKLLNDFEVIGVRDKMTMDALSSVLGGEKNIRLCCDPSFLYDFSIESGSIGTVLEDNRSFDKDKKTILLMTADRKLSDYIYRNFNAEFNLISAFHWHKGYYNAGGLSPAHWLYLLKNSDLVITTYFHATCFSIVFNTPFISFGVKNKSSKLEELLGANNLLDRYVPSIPAFVAKDGSRDLVLNNTREVDFSEIVKRYRRDFEDYLVLLEKENEVKKRREN